MATDWRVRYKDKITTLSAALRLIRRGEHLYISSGSAVPLGLVEGLVSDNLQLGDNEITHLMTLGEAPYCRPEYASRFRHNALFIGPNVREAVTAGRADYTPIFLSEIPAMIRARKLPLDVALMTVTPPNEDGWCSFGTHVDIAPAALDAVRLVVAQVNPLMPRVPSPSRIHVDQIHAMVEIARPLPELVMPPPEGEMEEIGKLIAELIPDGATLQLGIGGIPNAVVHYLGNRNDLGVHTEMFSDGVVDLAKRGVINGKRKTLLPGKIVASFLMGRQSTYEWVNENPMVELHPTEFANDPFVVAQNDDMIAINMALEIDLTGQVCADSIGRRFYSGIGGQVDFIRGAARSKRGKPIIAMPSTARGGMISRIVPRLEDGAGVVTTRGDVHYVVTEYGVADLHCKNVRERAMALISIAHPKFRPWLLAEAKQRCYVYQDQLELPISVPIYPKELESRVALSDGTGLFIRPIKPTDEEMLHDMFYRFSQETIYQRFFAVKKFLPHESLQRFCNVDYDKDMTLVAVTRRGEIEVVVGMALWALDTETNYAEAACVIADEYQGRGIASLLTHRLADIARSRGLSGFTADVLATNLRMIRVFEKLGCPVESTLHGETLSLRMPFDEAQRPVRRKPPRPAVTHS